MPVYRAVFRLAAYFGSLVQIILPGSIPRSSRATFSATSLAVFSFRTGAIPDMDASQPRSATRRIRRRRPPVVVENDSMASSIHKADTALRPLSSWSSVGCFIVEGAPRDPLLGASGRHLTENSVCYNPHAPRKEIPAKTSDNLN